MNLFISYSRDDKAWTYEFWRELRDETHYDVWIDQRLVGADIWWQTILDAIEACDCFIMIMTPRALDSIFCSAELDYALALNKPVLPLLLKSCDIPSELAAVQYVDISGNISLDRVLLRTIHSLGAVQSKIYRGEYPPQQAGRPPVPRPEPGQSEHVFEVFAYAEEAAAEDDLTRAESLYQQVIDADPEGLGLAAMQRLEEIRFEQDRAIAYLNIVRLAANRRTRRGAQAAWNSYVQKYGAEHDPENLAESLGQAEKPATSRPRRQSRPTQPPPPPKPKVDPKIQRLLDTITNPDMPPPERAAAGDELAKLGDPRPGVGLRADGLPDIDWVKIPAGEFLFGSDKDKDPLAYDDETPQRTVNLPAFYIARYPITWAQFQTFIDAPDGYTKDEWWRGLADREKEPYNARWAIANRPREYVSWYQSMAFCRWLSAKMGYEVTLPTEEQWEKAARGTDGRIYPWGNEYISGYANINETHKNYQVGPHYLHQTTSVGVYPQGASPYGILDMSGNVWEWCLTEYDSKKNNDISNTNIRVVRGGSWGGDRQDARVAIRSSITPDFRNNDLGFRPACSL